MADIKQAAKWMQDGKRVRRTLWGNSESIGPQSYRQDVVDQDGERTRFLVDDLLADDWQLAD
jgi:hypothetical protein